MFPSDTSGCQAYGHGSNGRPSVEGTCACAAISGAIERSNSVRCSAASGVRRCVGRRLPDGWRSCCSSSSDSSRGSARPARAYVCAPSSAHAPRVAAQKACERSRAPVWRKHGDADAMSFVFFIGAVTAILLIPVAVPSARRAAARVASARGFRARPRRRRGPDGRRNRPGRCGLGPARLALRRGSRCRRARAGDDAPQPRKARGEGRAEPRRGARPRRAGGRSRPRGPDGRGRDRGRRRQGRRLPPRGRDAPARGRPRVEHVVDPDLHARGRDRPAGPRDRHALLQPRPDDVARRGRPRQGDLRRDGRRDHRAGARARQDPRRRERLPRASSRTGS